MNEIKEQENVNSCNHNCEICPNREKKLAGTAALFPEFFQHAANATTWNATTGCNHAKVDLSGMFGGEIFSGQPAFEPASRNVTVCKQKKTRIMISTPQNTLIYNKKHFLVILKDEKTI